MALQQRGEDQDEDKQGGKDNAGQTLQPKVKALLAHHEKLDVTHDRPDNNMENGAEQCQNECSWKVGDRSYSSPGER
jgi:hypothetical protein